VVEDINVTALAVSRRLEKPLKRLRHAGAAYNTPLKQGVNGIAQSFVSHPVRGGSQLFPRAGFLSLA
jgi:hypothetical protein